MASGDASRTGAPLRGAALGGRAALLFAAAEMLAQRLTPFVDPVQAPGSPVDAMGFALLGAAWLLAGSIAGALVGWIAGRGSPAASHGERLGALTTLVPVSMVAAHAIAVTPPVSRLAFLLAGSGLAAALALTRGLGARGRVLAAAASPWILAPWLVALSAAMLGVERHASAGRQAGVALALGAAALAVAGLAGLASPRLGRGSPGAPRAASGLAVSILAWLAALALGSVAQAARRPELPPPRATDAAARPSVVLVTLDTVRGDHLSLYGYERDTSPRLAEFARRATVYTRAIASSDLTLSTHASLFTGLYAFQHGARAAQARGATALADGFQTLAEVLRDAGYLTVGVAANPSYLAKRYGVAQGFAHYDDRVPAPRLPELPSQLPGHSIGRLLSGLGLGGEAFERADESYRVAAEINREVFALLDRLAARPDPFFLFVNYMDAHWPYDPPPPYDGRFPGRLPPGEDPPGLETLRAARQLEAAPSEAQRRYMVSLYDGEIAYLDAELGRLLERLDSLGLLDRSLVVITADHGEAFGEHGLYSHGVSVYQDQVHVPLVIRRPGQQRGEVSEVWASSVDLLPTVLDALGMPVPERLGGRRLAGVSLLGEDPGARRVVMSESYPDPTLFAANPRFRRVERAVFDGDQKLIASSDGRRQLYDLRLDPGEERDLHSAPGGASHLEARLAEWLAEAPGGTGDAPLLDEATLRRMRALGYAR